MAPKVHHKKLDDLDRGALSGDKDERLALGHEKVRLGLVDSGLRDMLEAFGKLTGADETSAGLGAALGASATLTDPAEWATPFPSGQGVPALSEDISDLARLGEALRVYARDVQLSRPLDAQLVSTLRNSVACFDKAIGLLGAPGDPPQKKFAWLLAHRGAARSMIYWHLLTSSSNPAEHDPLFDRCTNDFDEACRLDPPYHWSLQFKAFLYALRGSETPARDGQPRVDDFDRAIELLKGVPEAERPSAIEHHIAMLSSYNAVGTGARRKSPAERSKAACESIDHGLEAVVCDQDEFFGAYSAAVSYWARYEMSKQAPTPDDLETARLRRLTDAVVDAAQTRARNTISQALAALVGLSFVRARLAWDDDRAAGTTTKLPDAVQKSRELLKFFDLVQPDLETRSIFIRDPAWQAILSSEDCRAAFESFGYDRLRTIAYWSRESLGARRSAAR
jgi:hypothetical protein